MNINLDTFHSNQSYLEHLPNPLFRKVLTYLSLSSRTGLIGTSQKITRFIQIFPLIYQQIFTIQELVAYDEAGFVLSPKNFTKMTEITDERVGEKKELISLLKMKRIPSSEWDNFSPFKLDQMERVIESFPKLEKVQITLSQGRELSKVRAKINRKRNTKIAFFVSLPVTIPMGIFLSMTGPIAMELSDKILDYYYNDEE